MSDIVSRLQNGAAPLDDPDLNDNAADEIERLRERLELYATNEDGSKRILLDDTSDGIACRDETIREQDAAIKRLREQLAKADTLLRAISPRSTIITVKGYEGDWWGILFDWLTGMEKQP